MSKKSSYKRLTVLSLLAIAFAIATQTGVSAPAVTTKTIAVPIGTKAVIAIDETGTATLLDAKNNQVQSCGSLGGTKIDPNCGLTDLQSMTHTNNISLNVHIPKNAPAGDPCIFFVMGGELYKICW